MSAGQKIIDGLKEAIDRDTERAAAQELKCGQCNQPLGAHGIQSDCRMFLGPASTVGADAERAAIVAWLKAQAEDDYPGYAHEHMLYWASDHIERGDHHGESK